MGAGNASWRRAIKMAQIIEGLPDTKGKPFQECDKEQKARMMMELAWKELTGDTYTSAWYKENSKYL